MHWNWSVAVAAALCLAFAVPAAQADSLSSVENARAKDRAGYYLNRQDREQLRRYGNNEDYGWGWRGGYYGDPGVSIYIGPRPYYGPYGY
jgi:hypothetical protein